MAVNRAVATDRRDELDLSNQELAQRAGISEGYLRNILSGSDSPGRRTVYAIERALRLPKGALLGSSKPDPDDDRDDKPDDEQRKRRTPPEPASEP